ncbi:hypothetical protein K431DRAFT_283892 [Polychaeton citri CBS 116435]|uniref:Histone deacetylase complex subunit SAP30 Sin3 binding domain-containing protein n=1 Tax=Polychaeton citri CBS 116435 TaxID=1314669 RepID=A0A9P4Q8D3_9PEZI|nr:hypothetical protein K431DRAFT_283892 [Polychaeton citri CBS 116435]
MPPAKKLANHDDTRSDTSTIRERQTATTANGRTSKKQAAKAQQNGGGSSLKELAMVSSEVAAGRAGDNANNWGPPGMAWQSLPTPILDRYRVAHHLPTPEAFTSPWRQALLTRPGGIGRHSPTMACSKQKRRVGKDQLAMTVRKHFNAAGVSESEVIVEFMYAVRHQGKQLLPASIWIFWPHTSRLTSSLQRKLSNYDHIQQC